MRIERIPIERINPAPYNPRTDLQPGDPEYEQLRRSIEEFGYVDPVIWNERTGVLVGGHQRFKVLVAGGATEVDCSVVDLDDLQEKALNIALNKISGGWDEERLRELLDELDEAGFDTTLTGFEPGELDEMMDALDEEIEKAESDGSLLDLANVTVGDPDHQVETGEVWLVGEHVLVVADVLTDWKIWIRHLDRDDAIFCPYPGPFVPLSLKAEKAKLVMVQPDPMIAGHILDQYVAVHGEGAVSRAADD